MEILSITVLSLLYYTHPDQSRSPISCSSGELGVHPKKKNTTGTPSCVSTQDECRDIFRGKCRKCRDGHDEMLFAVFKKQLTKPNEAGFWWHLIILLIILLNSAT